MFKNLANLASMMKQATKIGGRMEEMQSNLREHRVTGTAGGGLVQVEANGLGETLRIAIDPGLIQQGEKDVIEDLIHAANNDAHGKTRALYVEQMKSLTGGMSLPGLDEAMAQLAGGGDNGQSPSEPS